MKNSNFLKKFSEILSLANKTNILEIGISTEKLCEYIEQPSTK